MAWAHDGSIEKAIKILHGAKVTGANAVSIHVTDMPTYMVPYYGRGEGKVSAGREHLDIYKYLERINLSCENWKSFALEARKLNIDLCVMANDMISLNFAKKELNPKYFVISAASFIETDFVIKVAQCDCPTLFRIGGATLGEIEQTIGVFRQHSQAEIVLLHGFQNYPTKIEETNLYQLNALKEMFGVSVGLADHIDGGHIDAQIMPLLAIPLGATYIEKHITFDRNEKGEDFESALGLADFKQFVGFVRDAELVLGVKNWSALSPATLRYRGVSRKKIVAARNIEKDKAIEKSDVVFKRSDVGLQPDQLGYIIGRRTSENIQENDAITLEKLV